MLAIVLTLALAPVTAPAQTLADFAVRQPLATSGDKAFFRIELPDSVYDGAGRPDLGDLRVFNSDGALVPFAFMPRPAPVSSGSPRRALALFPLTVDTTRPEAGDLSIKLRRDAAGTTVDIRARDGTPVVGSRVVGYLLDAAPDDKPLVALLLSLPGTGNVNARLRVDASDDLDRWRTIVADAPLLALEYNGRRLTRDRVEFSPQSARYLRITWLTPSPPELTAVLGDIGDRLVDPPRRLRKATGVRDSESPDAFTFDLGAALPVERLTLELPEVNTVAPVDWEARTNAQDPWHAVGSSVVYRLRQDAGEVVNADHAISRMQLRYFRARLDPKAGGVGQTPPTLVAGLVSAGNRVRGARESAVRACLWQPADRARRAVDRNARARLCRRQAAPREHRRRGVIAAAVRREPVRDARAARHRRWLLWGSLVIASVLLGYMALRLARQMSASGPAPGGAAGSTSSTHGNEHEQG